MDKYEEEFKCVKTHANVETEPGWGLNYCGATIIPPESLKKFYCIISNANTHSQLQELKLLIGKISKAIKEKNF